MTVQTVWNGYKAACFDLYVRWFPTQAQHIEPAFWLKMALYQLVAAFEASIRTRRTFSYEAEPSFAKCKKILENVPSSGRVELLRQVFLPKYDVFALEIAAKVPFSEEEIEEVFVAGLKGEVGGGGLPLSVLALEILPVRRVIDLVFEHISDDDILSYVAYKMSGKIYYHQEHQFRRMGSETDWLYFEKKLHQFRDQGKLKKYFWTENNPDC